MSVVDRYCTACGTITHRDAKFCGSCGNAIPDGSNTTFTTSNAASPPTSPAQTSGSAVWLLAGIIILGLGVGSSVMYYNWLSSNDPSVLAGANQRIEQIASSVAEDSVKQYQTAKASGNKVDVCVHAGLVKAAYIQAKDEANTMKWNSQEGLDCAKAGMPAM